MLVNFSGGIDSAVVTEIALSEGMRVELVFWQYGQDNMREEQSAAIDLAGHFGGNLHHYDLPLLVRTNAVAFGCNASDHEQFPDCRPAFWHAINEALSAYGITAYLPLLNMTKRQVVDEAIARKVPIDRAWSCYHPQFRQPCGTCLACTTRAEAERNA